MWRGEREGGGRGEEHKTEQQNGHFVYFVVFFGPIETICFLLVFCIIRCIPWNFRPSIPNTSSLFYRMLQGENNDFPPKRGVYRKKKVFATCLRVLMCSIAHTRSP